MTNEEKLKNINDGLDRQITWMKAVAAIGIFFAIVVWIFALRTCS